MRIAIPVADAHAHASPLGLGASRISKKFKEHGGWFMALVSLPPQHYGLPQTLEGVIKAIELHLKQCDEARRAGIKVACIGGIHPAFVDHLIKRSSGKSLNIVSFIQENVMEFLAKMIDEGKLQGIGEFGRPHYKTIPESFAANDALLLTALEVIRDHGGVLHLHLEQGGQITVESVEVMVKSLGVRNTKSVVLHHATTGMALQACEKGLSATVTGRSEVLAQAKRLNALCVEAESDYIDDPKRPGVVMYPWKIAESVNELLGTNVEFYEFLYRVMVDNITDVYGVEPP